MRQHNQLPGLLLMAGIVIVSGSLWLLALSRSPVMVPGLREEMLAAQRQAGHGSETNEQRVLAEAYWLRYPDIRHHPYYGRSGPLGVAGPREHFRQHGEREGRLFTPLPVPEEQKIERELAEAYWQRYPDIEQSPVWGRHSSLAILGPRDHYAHYGRQQGRIWGHDN